MEEISDLSITLSSLEVANMIEKTHFNLLKDIRNYIRYLGEVNFHFTDFFQESTYKTEQNKELPCYQITRKKELKDGLDKKCFINLQELGE